MKESPVFPGFDNAFDNINFEIDPQIGFSQFLKEAKRFAEEKKQHPKQEEEERVVSTKQVTNEDKKCRKKSWKNAFLSFWRSSSNKKANKQQPLTKEASNGSYNHTKRRSPVSGPIYGVGGAVLTATGRQWNRRAASGPLAGLFNQKKDREKGKETPYVSLDKLSKPPYDAKTYGPVYLVS